MTVRNSLSAIIGLFYMFGPWLFGFNHQSVPFWTSVILGFILFAVSLLAYGKTGWNSWQNWISLLVGVWFILFPSIHSFSSDIIFIYMFLGITTVLLNYYNMNANSA